MFPWASQAHLKILCTKPKDFLGSSLYKLTIDDQLDLLNLFASSVSGTALVMTFVNPSSRLYMENLTFFQKLKIGITQEQGPEIEIISPHSTLTPSFWH